MSDMTNEEITAEFAELFGGSSEPDEEETSNEEGSENSEVTTEEVEGAEGTEGTEEEGTDESGDGEEDASQDESDAQSQTEPPSKPSKEAKQNHAFAEQRLRIKENEKFIRDIGKLMGFDDKASLEDIQAKAREVLIEKEAKDNNVPVEIMQRLDAAEQLIQENNRIKLETKVKEDFSELIDKHNLDEEAVTEFTTYLMDNGKNPMLDPSVDIEAEYLKLHYDDMVQVAVQEALQKEEARKEKAKDKSASSVEKSPADKDEAKVDSVKDLDDLFANTDL